MGKINETEKFGTVIPLQTLTPVLGKISLEMRQNFPILSILLMMETMAER